MGKGRKRERERGSRIFYIAFPKITMFFQGNCLQMKLKVKTLYTRHTNTIKPCLPHVHIQY